MTVPAGVLFDFTGTLFWIESAADAVAQALGPSFVGLAPELARVGAINGSGSAPSLPSSLEVAWRDRDLSPELHRRAYSGLAEHAGLTPAQAHLLYERGLQVGAWHPYDDTVAVLSSLRAQGIPVALVSNIGWDPRPVLAGYGVADLFARLVLSDERGVVKPDPAIFTAACAELGVEPADAVMVGDSPANDGGSVGAGVRFVEVDPSPTRPPGTLLRAVGLG